MNKLIQVAEQLLNQDLEENKIKEFDNLLIEYQQVNQFSKIKYGTAGFRDKSEKLLQISFRIGVYMGQAAKKYNTLGIQISASHNPVQDNGIKLVGDDGNMFDLTQEQVIEEFCNSQNLILQKEKNNKGNIILGHDSRPSCQYLLTLIKLGIQQAGSRFYDVGLVTTPQLHFLVWAVNNNLHSLPPKKEFYIEYFTQGNEFKDKIILDGGNGVGGIVGKQFNKVLNMEIINDGTTPEQVEQMNVNCGSEYVQKQKKCPKNLIPQENAKYISIDGDADRIVYYIPNQDGSAQLIEGDRFSILFGQYLLKKLQENNLNYNITIIQTAYANGASTKYITEVLKCKVLCEPTGVKYLHQAALKFDIAIYFEANGHGTIHYKQKILEEIKDEELKQFLKLSNQAVGDAFSNILLAETALQKLNMTVVQWLNLYQDYPSLTTKVKVAHKEQVKTNYEENQLKYPEDLKAQIEGLLENNYRAFVRASGTEDVVRVYCEGPEQNKMEKLSQRIEEFIKMNQTLN